MEELRKAIDDYENKHGKRPMMIGVSQKFFHEVVMMNVKITKGYKVPDKRIMFGLPVMIDVKLKENFKLDYTREG